MNWNRRYRLHLRSREWRYLKAYVISLRGRQCERCGNRYGKLHLHHKTYCRLGHEALRDVELLCYRCHKRADQERAWMNASARQ